MMQNNSNTARKMPNPAAGIAKTTEATEAAEAVRSFDGDDDDGAQSKIPGGVKKPGTP